MDKQKLSIDGLLKILPILEDIAEEKYDDCGIVNIRIHQDGNLRIDAENPTLLVSEAAENNIELIYLGKDRYGENCFEAHVPIMELQPLAGPGVPAPSPQSATPSKAVGTPQPTQQDSPPQQQQQQQQQPQPQAQPNQEQMVQAVMAQIMPEIEKQVGEMMQNFAKKSTAFWKSGSKSKL